MEQKMCLSFLIKHLFVLYVLILYFKTTSAPSLSLSGVAVVHKTSDVFNIEERIAQQFIFIWSRKYSQSIKFRIFIANTDLGVHLLFVMLFPHFQA